MMDFKKRKALFEPIAKYLKSNDCHVESLLGIRASLQAALVAVDKRLTILVKQRDVLKSKVKIEEDSTSWLD